MSTGSRTLVPLLLGLSSLLLLLFLLPLLLRNGSIGWWLMQSLPLALLLPGLAKPARRPLQWLGFLVLFYFLVAVLQLFSGDRLLQVIGGLSATACCLLFSAAIVRLRRLRNLQDTQ